MLVAEKYKYLEELEPQIVESPVDRPQARPAVRPLPSTAGKAASVFMVMICFAVACLVLVRYVTITENHKRVMSLNQTLENEYNARERLRVDLAFQQDLQRIETTAKGSLGMDYPEQGQVQYVSLPDPGIRREDTRVVHQPERSLWSRLLGLNP